MMRKKSLQGIYFDFSISSEIIVEDLGAWKHLKCKSIKI